MTLTSDNFQQYEIRKQGKQVAITDTVGFAEALVVLVEKLNEVMEFVTIEGEEVDDESPEDRDPFDPADGRIGGYSVGQLRPS